MTARLLALLRIVGRVAVGAPVPPRATGGYGLACRGALFLLFAVGLLLSLVLPGAGLVVMILAVLALLQFFLLQYRGWLLRPAVIGWLVAVAVAGAVIISVVWSRWDSGRFKADVMLLAVGLGALAVLPLVRTLFRVIFGPHHPESAISDRVDPPPLWFWVGDVGPDHAAITVRAEFATLAESVLVDYRRVDGGPGGRVGPAPLDRYRLATLALTGLAPDCRYDLTVRLETRDGDTAGVEHGSFSTFPPSGKPAEFTLAFASCTSTGSRGRVFDTIAQLEPRPKIFVVTGDLHYENLTATEPERFLDAFDMVHRSDPQRRLYTSMPMAYMWDDHDYGDNDSGADSPSREAARTAYRMAVPAYLPPGGTGAINQEFSVGRVRVLMTDNRSERGRPGEQLFGSDQERWLTERIADRDWPLVIWVSSTPWISDESGSDNWGAYAEQRRRIATTIGERAANLVMVSGDAHMVAIDDGSNSGFAGPGSGFPVLHAASLDRLGSTKGGPFSHGMYPGAGQFGIVAVDDRGHEIEVSLSGRSWTGAEIVGHSFTVPVQPEPTSPSG